MLKRARFLNFTLLLCWAITTYYLHQARAQSWQAIEAAWAALEIAERCVNVTSRVYLSADPRLSFPRPGRYLYQGEGEDQ